MCRCGGWLRYYQKQVEQPVPVPLQAVHVEATLLDHCARVEIRQTFANQETTPIEAVYQFPLSEDHAVCALEAEIDGRKVTAVCKRKEDALADYDDAIASGYGAYTLSHSDKEDMLTLNVGNLPPAAVVVVTVVYVAELQFYNGEAEWVVNSNTKEQSKFFKRKISYNIPAISITANLDMTSEIESVACLSHEIDYTPGTLSTQGTAKLVYQKDQIKLDKDFVLHLRVKESTKPIGRLEENENGKVCALVAIQPKLEWREGEALNSEIIIVVDRSASMAGKRIAQVRDSLQLLLRSLPEGVPFNIVGFGTTVDLLFKDGTKSYSQETFYEATKYIAGMKANLGGTDVLKVLEKIATNPPKPGQLRQVILLTDGQVFNTAECILFTAKQSRHTRVFTFGIGSDASEELVRGMAHAGNGLPEFITANQPLMEAKIMRQMERILLPAITDLQIDWGSVIVDRATSEQQRPLFSGDRRAVYALLRSCDNSEMEVTIRGQFGDQPWETQVKLVDKLKGSTLHALTAKKLIRELEVLDDLVNYEEQIIELSETYSVLSRYTTFIAVEERDEATEGTMQLRKVEAQVSADSQDALAHLEPHPEILPSSLSLVESSCEEERSAPMRLRAQEMKKKGGFRLGLPSWSLSDFGFAGGLPQASPSAPAAQSETSLGGAAKDDKQAKRIARERKKIVGKMQKAMEETILEKKEKQRSSLAKAASSRVTASVMRDMSSNTDGGGIVPSHSSQKGKEKEENDRKNAVDDDSSEDEDIVVDSRSNNPADRYSVEVPKATHLPNSPPKEMKELVFAQHFDGSWAASEIVPLLENLAGLSERAFKEYLAQTFSKNTKHKEKGSKSPRPKDDEGRDVWATAIALAILHEKYGDQKLNWKLLGAKAEKWLQSEAQKLGVTADSVLAEATKLIKKKLQA